MANEYLKCKLRMLELISKLISPLSLKTHGIFRTPSNWLTLNFVLISWKNCTAVVSKYVAANTIRVLVGFTFTFDCAPLIIPEFVIVFFVCEDEEIYCFERVCFH